MGVATAKWRMDNATVLQLTAEQNHTWITRMHSRASLSSRGGGGATEFHWAAPTKPPWAPKMNPKILSVGLQPPSVSVQHRLPWDRQSLILEPPLVPL